MIFNILLDACFFFIAPHSFNPFSFPCFSSYWWGRPCTGDVKITWNLCKFNSMACRHEYVSHHKLVRVYFYMELEWVNISQRRASVCVRAWVCAWVCAWLWLYQITIISSTPKFHSCWSRILALNQASCSGGAAWYFPTWLAKCIFGSIKVRHMISFLKFKQL